MKEMWDTRYSSKEYVYGTLPNDFFAQQLAGLEPGRILMPAEGEGRNAVFAAKLGWEVCAFDLSREGKVKAEKLAKMHRVNIEYQVGEFHEINIQENTFDAVGLIYAHFSSEKKTAYHKLLDKYLKKGGVVILEGFSKSHIQVSKDNKRPMGPPNPEMLFSVDEIKEYFAGFEILELKEVEVELNEGAFHVGTGAVVRFVGRKK